MKAVATSLDLTTIEVLLVQSSAYNMKGDLVDALSQRCDKLRVQIPLSKELKHVVACDDAAELDDIMAKMDGQGLDVPATWLLPEGPMLYANLAHAVMDLSHAKGLRKRDHTLKAATKKEAGPQVEDRELADILKSGQDDRIKGFKALLGVETMLVVLGKPLLDKLMERCGSIEKQACILRSLQKGAVTGNLEELNGILLKVAKAGLDNADVWLLPEGARLLARNHNRQKKLEEDAQNLANLKGDILAQLQQITSTVDIPAMKALLALADVYSVKGKEHEAVRDRCKALEMQVPLVEALFACGVTDDEAHLKQVMAKVQEAGLTEPSKWLLPEGVELARATARRVELLPKMSRLKEELQKAVTTGNLEDLRKVVGEAKSSGFDSPANWLLAGGPACWESASSKLQFMDQRQQQQVRIEGDLQAKIPGQMSSTDALAVKALVAQLDAVGISGQKIDALKERSRALDEQVPLLRQLQECLVNKDLAQISDLLGKVTTAGLDSSGNWILPDGPKAHSNAKQWQSILQEGEADKSFEREDLAQQIDVLGFSLDTSAMKLLISQAQACGVNEEAVGGLSKRCGTIEKQRVCRQQLLQLGLTLSSVEQAIADSQAAGLDDRVKSLFPDGPMLVSRARAWQSHLKQLPDGKASLPQKEEKHMNDLKACISNQSVEAVDAVLEAARSVNLDKSDAWKSAGGDQMAALVELHLRRLLDDEGEADISKADLDWQMHLMSSTLDDHEVKELVGLEFAYALREQLNTMQEQLRHRQDLQACAVSDNLEHVQAVHLSAQKAGLDVASNWILPDGPRIFAMVVRHMNNLDKEAKAAKEAVGEIERQMAELQTSLDLPAMHAVLVRAEMCKVNKDLKNKVQERCDALQKQLVLRKELQACSVCEDLTKVQRVIASMHDAGLNSPSKWLVKDGLKSNCRM